MTTTVHLAPVGAGKTEFALHRLLDYVHNSTTSFLKIWILLATRRQEVGFRQRLVELQTATSPVFFNVEFFNFYELNARLLNIAGKPQRRIQNSARTSMLRTIIDDMLQANELQYFRAIAHTPGFIAVLADLLDELKQNRVFPADFSSGARTAKDIEIASIYDRYQTTLIEHNLVDLEGEGWLALETISNEPHNAHDVDLLLVDGYDQFTPVQSQLLAELSRTIEQVDVTLTTVPDRGADYARRFARALNRLRDAHVDARVSFRTEMLEPIQTYRHPDLDILGQRIFQSTADNPTSHAIRLIEMPTPGEEVQAVLRSVKHQLYAGIQPDDILIVLRDWSLYEAFFESYQALYELPLLLHHRPAYHKTPVIAVLIDLLELAPAFARRDVLDVLRSPYIDSGLTASQIESLDRITLEKRLVRGSINEWLNVIDLAGSPSFDEDELEQEPLITPAEATELSLGLQTFLEGITPPKYQDVEAFVDWLERLIGQDPNQDPDTADDSDDWYDPDGFTLNIAARIYEGDVSSEMILRRDISALNGLKTILRYLLTTDLFMRSILRQTPHTDWQLFWTDLKLALQNTVDVPGNPSRTGRVLVTTATDARGLPHQHVYILGMAEGVFPAEMPEDPLYLDSERERLQLDSILLEVQAERIDDQGLFYELISLPRQTLILSRPTIQDGKEWIESHLWRAVNNVFPELNVQKMGIGEVVHAENCASVDEVMLAVADALNQSDAEDSDYGLRVRNWFNSSPTLMVMWGHIVHGRMVDNKRLSNQPHDQYSGYLLHPELQDAVADLLGVNRIWSASQLRDYGLCGFRYYAKRLLKLEELGEPDEGYDILQLGSLNHKILEETYNQLKEDDVPLHPDEKDFAIETLTAIAHEWFEKAPKYFGFRESPMWQNEQTVILHRLKALISLDFSADSPLNQFDGERKIYQQEEKFGYSDATVSDMRISLSAEESLRIRGVIDRIDRVGDKLVVVDYKTGSTAINTAEMVDGHNFQMMTYILALMTILETTESDLQLAGGMFFHLRNLKASGVFHVSNPDDMNAIESAKLHIVDNLESGRKGEFPVHANRIEEGKCVKFCEYSHLCRMSVTNPHK